MIGPSLFSIGPLTIPTFGFFAMLGLMVPMLLLEREFERVGFNPMHAYGVTLAAALGGLAGARIYFVVEHWERFLASPGAVVASGGWVFYGGLIGGFLAVAVYTRIRGLSLPRVCDLTAPLLALGQAFGRMGCLLSGDGDYGPPSDVAWAMAFPRGLVPTSERVHPTPIYDMIILVAIFLLLWRIRKRDYRVGALFSLYLVLVGVGRFFTEFYRRTPEVALGLTMAQLISLALIVGGAAGLWLLRTRAAPAGRS